MSYAVRNDLRGWRAVAAAEDVGAEEHYSAVVPQLPGRPIADVIAERRYMAEIAGLSFGGVAIDTGRDSQGLISGAAVAALIDPNYSLEWKAPESPGGRVTLTGQEVLAVASAVRAHVQACFNREFALNDAVAAGTYTEQMLEEGWPS